jgi:hypothetical protein
MLCVSIFQYPERQKAIKEMCFQAFSNYRYIPSSKSLCYLVIKWLLFKFLFHEKFDKTVKKRLEREANYKCQLHAIQHAIPIQFPIQLNISCVEKLMSTNYRHLT